MTDPHSSPINASDHARALSAALEDLGVGAEKKTPFRLYFDVDVITPVIFGEEHESAAASTQGVLHVVGALWSAGYIGPVYLLRPHMIELHRQLYKSSRHPPDGYAPRDDPGQLYDVEIRKLKSFSQQGLTFAGAQKFREELQELAVPTFVRIELLRLFWKSRLRELTLERDGDRPGSPKYRLLDLGQPGPLFKEIESDERLPRIRSLLDERRPEKTENNYYDAMALLAIGRMIRQSEESGTLVRFHSATRPVLELCRTVPEVGALLAPPGVQFTIDHPRCALRSALAIQWLAVLRRLLRGDAYPGLVTYNLPYLWKQAAEILNALIADPRPQQSSIAALRGKLNQLYKGLFLESIWLDEAGPVGQELSKAEEWKPLWKSAVAQLPSITRDVESRTKELGTIVLGEAESRGMEDTTLFKIEASIGVSHSRSRLLNRLRSVAKNFRAPPPAHPWHELAMERWAPQPDGKPEAELGDLLSRLGDPTTRDLAIDELADRVEQPENEPEAWAFTAAALTFVRAFGVASSFVHTLARRIGNLPAAMILFGDASSLRDRPGDNVLAHEVVRRVRQFVRDGSVKDRHFWLGSAYTFYLAFLTLRNASEFEPAVATESIDAARRALDLRLNDAITALAVDHICFVTIAAGFGPAPDDLHTRLLAYKGTEYWTYRLHDTALFCELWECERRLGAFQSSGVRGSTEVSALSEQLEGLAREYDRLVEQNPGSPEIRDNAKRTRKAVELAKSLM
ncbi:hypothetical protein PHYC_02331 [Phycisphaerales bacterium]|nr:hypothetical protein PHYC_02331 [Phycisphaerales bacterium]